MTRNRRLSNRTLQLVASLILAAACSADTVHNIFSDDDGGFGEGGIDDASSAMDASIRDHASGNSGRGGSDIGNSGRSGNENSGGNGSSGFNGGLERDASCAGETQSVELTPLDMIIALDTSYSMDFLGKWPAVKQAINIFVSDSDFVGLGVGIQYFPIRKQCSANDYAELDVDVGLLPDNAQPISDSLESQCMSGGTPMAPMLEGVLSYARQRAENDPERNVVVVVATDGIPDTTCISESSGSTPNTLENVVALAEEAAAGEPSISTFIVGVGTELTALNEIARAGSGADAFFVDTAADIQAVFLRALTEIRKRALACEHAVPEIQSGTQVINYDKVNVVFSFEGNDEVFFKVSDKEQCDQIDAFAWYYDDPDNPQKIVLCPETCDQVQTIAEGVFNVEFGCDTILF
ncbi:MAG: VWA domain-containing protein [Deltaproteobacteria bacterium]|nr:VWA domain-containing protein [Deltaproteobacteria bacterium]